jgi:hypothetical protein
MQSNAAFKGQNNYYPNMPALMSDDREQRSWYPEAVVDNNIKKSANITSNWEYRKYLVSNADNIMDINMRNAIMQNPSGDIIKNNELSRPPYLFKGVNDMTPVRPGVFGSDLKSVYLSREQLQAKSVAPSMYSTTSR